MLLAAVDETMKQDLIAPRVSQNIVKSIFRLYIVYQPGGSAEKSHVLRQLQSPAAPTTLQEALALLRA